MERLKWLREKERVAEWRGVAGVVVVWVRRVNNNGGGG